MICISPKSLTLALCSFQVVENITDLCVWGGGWFPSHFRHRPRRLFGRGLWWRLRPYRSAFSKRHLQLGRNGVPRWGQLTFTLTHKQLVTTLQSAINAHIV